MPTTVSVAGIFASMGRIDIINSKMTHIMGIMMRTLSKLNLVKHGEPGTEIYIEDTYSRDEIGAAKELKLDEAHFHTESDENSVSVTPVEMGGASETEDGTSGIVPAPSLGDEEKYLRGDGTWATPQDTTYHAGEGILITDDVISVDGAAHYDRNEIDTKLAADETSWKAWSNNRSSGSTTFSKSIDDNGNPLLDANGNPVLDTNGNAIDLPVNHDGVYIGRNTHVYSDGSVALGDNNLIDSGMAQGYVLGKRNSITNKVNPAVAIGDNNKIIPSTDRNNSVGFAGAFGQDNTVDNEGIAIGKRNNTASFGIAIGQRSHADNAGISIGSGMSAMQGSLAMGTQSSTESYCTTVCYKNPDGTFVPLMAPIGYSGTTPPGSGVSGVYNATLSVFGYMKGTDFYAVYPPEQSSLPSGYTSTTRTVNVNYGELMNITYRDGMNTRSNIYTRSISVPNDGPDSNGNSIAIGENVNATNGSLVIGRGSQSSSSAILYHDDQVTPIRTLGLPNEERNAGNSTRHGELVASGGSVIITESGYGDITAENGSMIIGTAYQGSTHASNGSSIIGTGHNTKSHNGSVVIGKGSGDNTATYGSFIIGSNNTANNDGTVISNNRGNNFAEGGAFAIGFDNKADGVSFSIGSSNISRSGGIAIGSGIVYDKSSGRDQMLETQEDTYYIYNNPDGSVAFVYGEIKFNYTGNIIARLRDLVDGHVIEVGYIPLAPNSSQTHCPPRYWDPSLADYVTLSNDKRAEISVYNSTVVYSLAERSGNSMVYYGTYPTGNLRIPIDATNCKFFTMNLNGYKLDGQFYAFRSRYNTSIPSGATAAVQTTEFGTSGNTIRVRFMTAPTLEQIGMDKSALGYYLGASTSGMAIGSGEVASESSIAIGLNYIGTRLMYCQELQYPFFYGSILYVPNLIQDHLLPSYYLTGAAESGSISIGDAYTRQGSIGISASGNSRPSNHSMALAGSAVFGLASNFAASGSCVLGSNSSADNDSISVGMSNKSSSAAYTFGFDNRAFQSAAAVGVSNSASSSGWSFGYMNDATGNSLAFGTNNFSKSYAVAVGRDNRAEDDGLAIGAANKSFNAGVSIGTYNTTYSGGFAYGSYNSAHDDALAYGNSQTALCNAVCVGRFNNASGYSFAFGGSNQSAGSSTTLGAHNTALGASLGIGADNLATNKSIAFGANNQADSNSILIGYTNGNTHGWGILLGWNNMASPANTELYAKFKKGHSILIGAGNQGYGSREYIRERYDDNGNRIDHAPEYAMSVLLGSSNVSFGSNNIAVGVFNHVGIHSDESISINDYGWTTNDGFATAIGYGNTAGRNYDMAIGYYSTAIGGENIAVTHSTAFGCRNMSYNASYVQFGVGNIALSSSLLGSSSANDSNGRSTTPAGTSIAFDNILHRSSISIHGSSTPTNGDYEYIVNSNLSNNVILGTSLSVDRNFDIARNFIANASNQYCHVDVTTGTNGERGGMHDNFVFGLSSGNMPGICARGNTDRNVVIHSSLRPSVDKEVSYYKNEQAYWTDNVVIGSSELTATSTHATFNLVGMESKIVGVFGHVVTNSIVLNGSAIQGAGATFVSNNILLNNSTLIASKINASQWYETSTSQCESNVLIGTTAQDVEGVFSFCDGKVLPYSSNPDRSPVILESVRVFNFGDSYLTRCVETSNFGNQNTIYGQSRGFVSGSNNLITTTDCSHVNEMSENNTIFGSSNSIIGPRYTSKNFIVGDSNNICVTPTYSGYEYTTNNTVFGTENRFVYNYKNVSSATEYMALQSDKYTGCYQITDYVDIMRESTVGNFSSGSIYYYIKKNTIATISSTSAANTVTTYTTLSRDEFVSRASAGTLSTTTAYKVSSGGSVPSGYTLYTRDIPYCWLSSNESVYVKVDQYDTAVYKFSQPSGTTTSISITLTAFCSLVNSHSVQPDVYYKITNDTSTSTYLVLFNYYGSTQLYPGTIGYRLQGELSDGRTVGTYNSVYNFVAGCRNYLTANTHHNFVFGGNNVVNSNINLPVLSSGTAVAWSHSVIFGTDNMVESGSYQFLMGHKNHAIGPYAVGFGCTNIVNQNQFVVGSYNEALPGGTDSLYKYLPATKGKEILNVTDGAVFIVGNGYNTADPFAPVVATRSNAMVVYQSGKVVANEFAVSKNGTTVSIKPALIARAEESWHSSDASGKVTAMVYDVTGDGTYSDGYVVLSEQRQVKVSATIGIKFTEYQSNDDAYGIVRAVVTDGTGIVAVYESAIDMSVPLHQFAFTDISVSSVDRLKVEISLFADIDMTTASSVAYAARTTLNIEGR